MNHPPKKLKRKVSNIERGKIMYEFTIIPISVAVGVAQSELGKGCRRYSGAGTVTLETTIAPPS